MGFADVGLLWVQTDESDAALQKGRWNRRRLAWRVQGEVKVRSRAGVFKQRAHQPFYLSRCISRISAAGVTAPGARCLLWVTCGLERRTEPCCLCLIWSVGLHKVCLCLYFPLTLYCREFESYIYMFFVFFLQRHIFRKFSFPPQRESLRKKQTIEDRKGKEAWENSC